MTIGSAAPNPLKQLTSITIPGTALLLLMAIVAFWPSYIADPVKLGSGYTHFHAITGALWFALVLIQPVLIQSGRRDLHRNIGRISWLLGPLTILAMFLGAHATQEMFQVTRGEVLPYVFWLQWWLGLMFGVFWVLAMVLRKDRFLHARFMVATTLTFIDPVVARVAGRLFEISGQHASFTVINLVLLGLIYIDRNAPRRRWVWPAVLVAFLAFEIPMLLGFATSETWRAVTLAYVSLPLTP